MNLPITSQVQQVIFQKGNTAEEFRHRYSYDADNRLTLVEVSRDTVNWEKAAAYEYYLHGPMKSTGLGDSIQKMDYVYNLQGWLKAINPDSPPLLGGVPEGGGGYSADVFASILNYYAGDYNRTGKGLDATASITPQSGTHVKNKGKDLFNGNISSWVTYTGFDQTASTADPLMAQGYRYDKLNRLVSTFAETKVTSGFSGWTNSGTSKPDIYQENLRYDANGNIDTLIRTCGNTIAVAMDNMYYRYANTTTDYYGRTKKTSNKLGYIDDDTDLTGVDDIKDQASGNYEYDAKGRLIGDLANEIDTIIWTPYDKVREIIRTSGSTKARLQFTYDAMGRRVSKKVIRSTTDSTQNTVTYYAYDASGNLMGTYLKEFTSDTSYKYTITEEYIYGSSRVGSYNNGNVVYNGSGTEDTIDIGKLRFEITDHLGNVRAVVTGEKTGTGHAEIVYLADYYAFGMEMPGRKFEGSDGYRYGFNGKEKDDEWSGDGNSVDFGARIYDSRVARFLSVDPDTDKYPYWSPYIFAANNPIRFTDVNGKGPGDRVTYAEDFIGTPYKQQTEWDQKKNRTFLRTGSTDAALEYIDCSELVMRVLAADGITETVESKSTQELVEWFTEENGWHRSDEPREGDVFLWRYYDSKKKEWKGHTGIVKTYDPETETVTIVHAKGTKDGTLQEDYNLTYFTNHDGWKGFYRPMSEQEGTPEHIVQSYENEIAMWKSLQTAYKVMKNTVKVNYYQQVIDMTQADLDHYLETGEERHSDLPEGPEAPEGPAKSPEDNADNEY